MSGLIPSSTAVPTIPMNAERRNPGLERSIRYHKNGLTMARVRETCKVDCQGSLRFDPVSYNHVEVRSTLQ